MRTHESWPNLEDMIRDKAFLFIPLVVGVAIFYPLSKVYDFAARLVSRKPTIEENVRTTYSKDKDPRNYS